SEAVTGRQCRAELSSWPRSLGWLAADLAHRPVGAHEVDTADVVARPLQTDRPRDLAREVVVGAAIPQDRPQVELVEGEEAGADLAAGGDAHAVAALAERRGDARDHADITDTVAVPVARRGLGAVVIEVRHLRLEREHRVDRVEDLARGKRLVHRPVAPA